MSYNPDIYEEECPFCAATFNYGPHYQEHVERCQDDANERRQAEADARREALEDPAIEG